MSKIITVDYINQVKFYQMPKAFFHNPKYVGMVNESKIAYMILRDLLDLSIKNQWINEEKQVYVKLSREKLMKYLNIKGTAKYAKVMKELIEKELIVKKSLGLNRVDETYVCIPDDLAIIYSDEELLDMSESKKSDEKEVPQSEEISGGLKNERPEVSKSNVKKFENQTHINTNFTKTDFNNTNSSSSNEEIREEEALKEKQLDSLMTMCQNQMLRLRREVAKSFLETYGYEKLKKAIVTTGTAQLTRDINNVTGYINCVLNDLCKKEEKNITVNITKNNKADSNSNFEERDYDWEKEEDELMGWF